MPLLSHLRADNFLTDALYKGNTKKTDFHLLELLFYTCTNVTATFLVFDAYINNFCSTTRCYG